MFIVLTSAYTQPQPICIIYLKELITLIACLCTATKIYLSYNVEIIIEYSTLNIV